MLYNITLRGGSREDNVYFTGILKRRLGGCLVSDERSLLAALRSRHDLVSIEACLLRYKLFPFLRPVETFYSSEDDPC